MEENEERKKKRVTIRKCHQDFELVFETKEGKNGPVSPWMEDQFCGFVFPSYLGQTRMIDEFETLQLHNLLLLFKFM